jgi:hypothetical protein
MSAPYCLYAQQSTNVLYSSNGLYRLLMQTDGNVVEADAVSNSLLWDTAAHGGKAGLPSANYRLCMQSDGNLVEAAPPYGLANVLWQSNTPGHSPCSCVLTLQNDANLVDADGSTALWFDGANSATDAPYFSIYGQWTVPQDTSSTAISDWVGIEGPQVAGDPGNTSIIQAGTDSANGASYFWVEDWPQGEQPINQTYGQSMAVYPGDSVAVELQNDLNGWTEFWFWDNTPHNGHTEYTYFFDESVPYRSSVSPVAIHEDKDPPSFNYMPSFGSVPFSQCEYEITAGTQSWYWMTGASGGGSATGFTTVQNGTTKASISGIGSDGGFTVTWVHN